MPHRSGLLPCLTAC